MFSWYKNSDFEQEPCMTHFYNLNHMPSCFKSLNHSPKLENSFSGNKLADKNQYRSTRVRFLNIMKLK